MKGKLARSTLQTGLMLGLRAATQATVLVLLARLLGPTVYGNFAALAALAVVLGMLPQLGAGFIMLARNADGDAGIVHVWRYAWPLTLILGLLLLGGYVVAARWVTSLPLPLALLTVLGATELLLTPFALLASFALQAREQVPLSQVVQWLPLALRVPAIVPCFAFDPARRLFAYAGFQFAATALGVLIGLWLLQRHLRLDWRPRRASRAELHDGASYALMNLVAANPSELDKIAAVRIVGAHDAGIYTVTARVMNAVVTPVTALLLASLPRLFRHGAAPSREGHRLIRWIAVLSLGWGVLGGIALALCSPWLPRLFGPTFEDAARLLPWLAVAAPLLSMRLCAGAILVALGKPMQRVAFEIGGILALLISMLAFTPHYGFYGLAMAVIVAEACMAALGWSMVRQRLTRLPAG